MYGNVCRCHVNGSILGSAVEITWVFQPVISIYVGVYPLFDFDREREIHICICVNIFTYIDIYVNINR